MADDTFTLLVDRHYAGLYRFALSLAGSPSDACDLTQQTFYTWARKGHTLRDATKAKSWLFTTLHREFLRSRRHSTRERPLEEIEEPESEAPGVEADYVRKLDAQIVWAALASIDEIFRAPLTLFYLEELSYQEIAATLDVPAGTVMSRLARGKSHLRAALARSAGAPAVLPFQSIQRNLAP